MRKNDLIKYLQSIEGNPEVLMWNSFVSDWHSVKFQSTELFKITKKHHLEMCRIERCIDTNDWDFQLPEDEVKQIEAIYDRMQYDDNPFLTEEDLKLGLYKRKKVVMIYAKLRGKTTWDRVSGVSY